MRKLQKPVKLQLNKETLTRLDEVWGGNRTVDITACVTNCPACETGTRVGTCLC